MAIPTIKARFICRVDGVPIRPLLAGLASAELRPLVDTDERDRPVIVGYIAREVLGVFRRRGGHGPYAADGVWAEVWTYEMVRTPYALYVRDQHDADEQLTYLSTALKVPRDSWTIKPPRRWMGYGCGSENGRGPH